MRAQTTAAASRPFPTRRETRPARGKTLAYLLAAAERELTACGIDTPRLDAEVLLADALEIDRTALYARLADMPSAAQRAAFRQRLTRRTSREPIAYITGKQEFWSLEFAVEPDVLIPRSETELVVETSLGLFDSHATAAPHIADIGTGSGCIAIALATELPRARFRAMDRSLAALTIAHSNARRHGVATRIGLWCGDLLDAATARSAFDLIVTNPPYVATSDLDRSERVAPEVRDWEPRAALDGGSDGLDYYRQLLSSVSRNGIDHLRAGGWFVAEIGYDQQDTVRALARGRPDLSFVRCVRDSAGRDRVVVFRKTP